MKTIFKKYIVKTWDELTEEEKEKKKDEYYIDTVGEDEVND